MPSVMIDFVQLTQRLAVSALDPSAAGAHGMLSGPICAGRDGAEAVWLNELLAGTDPHDLRARAQIGGPGLGLVPLLPADERPLPERARQGGDT